MTESPTGMSDAEEDYEKRLRHHGVPAAKPGSAEEGGKGDEVGGEVVGEEGEGEDGSDSDSVEDDDGDDEPSLKYERITGALPGLLKKDTAASLAVGSTRVVSARSVNVCKDPLGYLRKGHICVIIIGIGNSQWNRPHP